MRIRTLQWGEPEQMPPRSIFQDKGGVKVTADTILGEYSVQSFDGNQTFHALGRHMLGKPQQDGFTTIEEAKIAANMFYMSVMRSAMEDGTALPAEGCDSAAAAQSSSETNHGH